MSEQLGVVFVHGFNSSAAVWEPFVRLIEDDPDLAFVAPLRFTYDTRLWQPDPRRQIPTFDTTADNLMEYLESAAGNCERLVLAAHSQGGLVVQRYLLRMLGHRGRGRELSRRIRSVILFACPNDGSQFGLALRRVFMRSNPQERQLRPLDEQITDTRAFVINRVVHAREVSEGSCPIPIVVYAGESDKIVTPASCHQSRGLNLLDLLLQLDPRRWHQPQPPPSRPALQKPAAKRRPRFIPDGLFCGQDQPPPALAHWASLPSWHLSRP
ncbi:esterase/lipase family protein [Streptomyces sp. IBSBF 2390]|uniref:esterase/lipase family protein n=1 Tax=Streptomyces sp. IBSBF 2390 TaxID=2903533 RepID=UPI003FA7A59E